MRIKKLTMEDLVVLMLRLFREIRNEVADVRKEITNLLNNMDGRINEIYDSLNKRIDETNKGIDALYDLLEKYMKH